MTGVFGIVAKEGEDTGKEAVLDLFFGTDYHCHLGTKYGGISVFENGRFNREIHRIDVHSFRSRFEDYVAEAKGSRGIGVISDYEPQPLIIDSRLGNYSIVHVGKVNNLEKLADDFKKNGSHFAEMSRGEINPTEVIAGLVNQGKSFADGIEIAQNSVEGSSSLLLLTKDGIYAARDRLGRTPLVIGKKENAFAVASESCSFPARGFRTEKYLGAGEIMLIGDKGYEQIKKPEEEMQVCSFLWVYYGFPAANYEGINVEKTRYSCGRALAKVDKKEGLEIDLVAGIPDSGTGHAIGYANEMGVDYGRPYTKYTPTWPRSFMPQEQNMRELVAKMKLIPIPELISGKRILFCEDSIVRGTQLRDTVKVLFNEHKAKEIHMRPACPPLFYGCKFLNFSRSRNEFDLAGRRAIRTIGGKRVEDYLDENSENFRNVVEAVRDDLGLTSLRYQKLGDLVKAIGLPKEKLCTYCWDGCEGCGK